MFIINPDPYSLPCYRIGPFTTADLSRNHYLPYSDQIDIYLEERFDGKEYIYTYNGRSAINKALSFCDLTPDDIVTIITTSGNFYISSCVTDEIARLCRWSREILPETKAIFVNHEFGYPYNGLNQLKEYGLPIIEDCAGSFFSENSDGTTGTVGDFVVYSFPKMFPLQVGGLLVSNRKISLANKNTIDKNTLQHVKNVLSYYIGMKDQITNKRQLNYLELRKLFSSIGFDERFELKEGIVPGVFMFRTEKYHLDLSELKKYYWAHGVQCSVFYGEASFFIPCHQNLNRADMLYFSEIMKSFVNKD